MAIGVGMPWFAGNLLWVATSGWTDQIMTSLADSDFLGSWNHWMFTKNANTGYMSVFHNGSTFYKSSPSYFLAMPGFDAAAPWVASWDGANYQFQGKIDDWRTYNKCGTGSLAARLAGGDPEQAYWESPVNGTVEVAYEGVLLSWVPGNGAVTHTLNWGYTTAMPNVVPGLTEQNYALPNLDLVRTYYWRVDEVNVGTVTVDVWEFATLDSILVEDFEGYDASG